MPIYYSTFFLILQKKNTVFLRVLRVLIKLQTAMFLFPTAIDRKILVPTAFQKSVKHLHKTFGNPSDAAANASFCQKGNLRPSILNPLPLKPQLIFLQSVTSLKYLKITLFYRYYKILNHFIQTFFTKVKLYLFSIFL